MPSSRGIVSGFAVALSLACGNSEAGEVTTTGELPKLTLHYQTSEIETSPNSLMERVIVATDGRVAMTANQEADHLVTVLDSSGALLAEIGKRGTGPGEMRMAQLIMIDDQGVTMFDPMQQKLVILGLNDSLHSQVAFTEQFMPIYMVNGQLQGLAMGGNFLKVMSGDPATGTLREVIPVTDSFMIASFPKPDMASTENMMEMRIPALGFWGDKIVVGEGHGYRIMVYNADGTPDRIISRDIPPAVQGQARIDAQTAMMRSAMARFGVSGPEAEAQMTQVVKALTERKMPHFAAMSLMPDAANRGWVLGSVGDSAFADVFSDSGFIGRLGIPCHAFSDQWSLSGDWLAVVCAPDNPDDDREALVKVFRIN